MRCTSGLWSMKAYIEMNLLAFKVSEICDSNSVAGNIVHSDPSGRCMQVSAQESCTLTILSSGTLVQEVIMLSSAIDFRFKSIMTWP